MFIATANMIEGIPYPLFDRMEIITLSGYTEDEKIDIANNFLFQKILKNMDLTPKQFKISDDMLQHVDFSIHQRSWCSPIRTIISKINA